MRPALMKKAAVVGAVIILALSAAGCGASRGGGSSSATPPPPPAGIPAGLEGQPNLADHGDSVSITFPAEMFEGVELSPEFIEVNDYIGAETNNDGTVTITMSKELQRSFMAAFQSDVDYNIEYFTSEVDYLKEITYTEDMRSMQMYVEGYTDDDLLPQLIYFFCYPFEQYQFMLGQNVYFVITVYDAKTGEVVSSLTYPDDMI